MCSSSKAHYSSYGTLWYNCNLCAKILWKICSSWSSHCAMCSSLCAGYRTLWSLEFTAEGDSTKGKVWQQHQVALEHTQLHNNFLSLFWGVPRAIGTDMVTMESNALKLILTDKQGTSIWIKWSVRNTLLECWNQSELEWTIVIPGQCWGWLTKWEQRVHKCQPMGPAASARGGARGVPGGLTGPHLVSTSCHCCSAGINLTINQINRLTSFNCSIVSVALSRIKVIFWWEDPGIGRMIKETQLWRKRWRSSGSGQIMNGAGRGILLLLQTDTDCAERAHKIWEMLICSLQSRPKLPQTAALARFNS